MPDSSDHSVFNCIEHEDAFDSVERRALAKVLSLYGMPDKYIIVINDMCENNLAAGKIR